MLTELRKVIPSWVRRVDVADRGSAWSDYMEHNDAAMADLASAVFGSDGADEGAAGVLGPTGSDGPDVTLVDWDPDAEVKVVTAMLYPYTTCSEEELAGACRSMSVQQRMEVMGRYAGERPTGGTGRGGRSSAARIPFRRGVGLWGFPGPAAPPAPDHRMAGPDPLPRLHDARSGHGGRRGRGVRGSHGPLGVAVRGSRGAFRRHRRRLRRDLGLPHPLQRAVERPGGDAHARVAHDPSGPSRVPQGVPDRCTA